ncbi:MAG: hypothetical protein SFU98_01565, partial [Leptospiraceae bacterium]|nr:hypothetical protein [Leptospiraceae bacterium]
MEEYLKEFFSENRTLLNDRFHLAKYHYPSLGQEDFLKTLRSFVYELFSENIPKDKLFSSL